MLRAASTASSASVWSEPERGVDVWQLVCGVWMTVRLRGALADRSAKLGQAAAARELIGGSVEFGAALASDASRRCQRSRAAAPLGSVGSVERSGSKA
ncbi:hypothetical protein JOF35_008835 [Streptomyces demainii]|uniref:Uncharacterized protein n=1 Tax=Streptomyces demainii TaxID=588122 RepID=A0ABT9L9M3_9ACTN|nr:hypothetical protein [Streptomyces demainii]